MEKYLYISNPTTTSKIKSSNNKKVLNKVFKDRPIQLGIAVFWSLSLLFAYDSQDSKYNPRRGTGLTWGFLSKNLGPAKAGSKVKISNIDDRAKLLLPVYDEEEIPPIVAYWEDAYEFRVQLQQPIIWPIEMERLR